MGKKDKVRFAIEAVDLVAGVRREMLLVKLLTEVLVERTNETVLAEDVAVLIYAVEGSVQQAWQAIDQAHERVQEVRPSRRVA